MYIEPDLSKRRRVVRWRYLDSLDSTRYSHTEFVKQGAPRALRIKQASVEIIATMLMGNGIIVPNNQLIDSIGFLRNASTMIDVASRLQSVFVPILYANYDYSHEKTGGKHLKDPFLLASYLYDKDGVGGRDYFELSALPDLGKRRRQWADCMRDRMMGIPSRLVQDRLEDQLATDLFRILGFFSMNNHLIVDANPTKGIREFMTLSIAALTRERLEVDEFFALLLTGDSDMSADRVKRLMDIIGVFKRLEANGLLDNRSRMREGLVNSEEAYFEDVAGSIESTRAGVLRTFNSIYNFANYKSTRAAQDNQTEPLHSDNIWGPDEAAFALGRWARENYESCHRGKIATLDIASHQDSFVNPRLNEEPIEGDAGDLRAFWEAFFDRQQGEEWDTSLTNYMNSLRRFEQIKREYHSRLPDEMTSETLNDLLSAAGNYEECRAKQVDNASQWLPGGYRLELDEHEKLTLVCVDDRGETTSKIQIEDFAQFATYTKVQKGAQYAAEADEDVSTKGYTAEYGEGT